MSERLVRFATSPQLALLFRLYIGGLFIYASMYKIGYAGEFANAVADYRMLPYWAVHPVAVVLPWVELICGIQLVVGFRSKAAAAIISMLMAVFTVAIVVNVTRGTPASCGCFHGMEEPMTWGTVWRDLIWLAMCVHIFRYDTLLQLERVFLPKVPAVSVGSAGSTGRAGGVG